MQNPLEHLLRKIASEAENKPENNARAVFRHDNQKLPPSGHKADISPVTRLEAELLLAHACKLRRVQLFTRDSFSATEISAFQNLWMRRAAGEPIAYLLGKREFYGRVFFVNEHVLIPRPETELLVEAVLARLPAGNSSGAHLLELGTGSGCIAITLACEQPAAHIVACDISAQALHVAQTNARTHGCTNITWCASDWYTHLPTHDVSERFDLIVANPPYLAQDDAHLQQGDLRFEPQQALHDGADGLSAIRHIVLGAPTFLKPAGWLLLEHGYTQAAAVQALMRGAFELVETLPDLAGHGRVTVGKLNNA